MTLRIPKLLPRVLACVLLTTLAAHALHAQSVHGAARSPLEEIVVTSSRIPMSVRELGTAMSVVTSEDIELQGSLTLADILRTQPGVGVSNAGGQGKATSVRIRGEESYRTLVMIDGVKVSDPTGTQVGPDFANILATSDIEQVEILRGPQGFIYGADAGGIVSIMTRRGVGDLGGQLAIEAGEYDTQKIDLDAYGGNDRSDYFFSVAGISSDGFNARESDTTLADNDGYDNTTLHAKLGWSPSDDLRLQLVARDVDASTEFDQCGFPVTHDCVGDTQQTTYRLSADWRTGRATHVFAYSASDISRANFADSLPSFETGGDLTGFEYTGSYRPAESTTLVYGVDLQNEHVAASTGDDLRRNQQGFYFEYQGHIGEQLYLTLGGRKDRNDDFGTHTSVRGTLAYVRLLDSGATLKYRAGYGTGFRAPSLYEVAYNRGPFAFPPASATSLSEESSAGYDIGVEYTNEQGLYLAATYFDQRIADEILFDLSGFSGYLQSAGTTSSTGVELALDVPVGERFAVVANSTFNDAETEEGLQRIRRPKRLGNVGLRFVSAGTKLRIWANYRFSGSSVDEVFGVGRIALDDYRVLDLSAAYRVSDLIEVYGRIENVTKDDYQEIVGYLTGGSIASAGVRLRF